MAFTDLFGATPRNRILDFLGDHPAMDYNITDIAEKAGVSRPTVHGHIEELVGLGLVVRTRNVGRSRMFRINTDNAIVREVLGTDMLQARGLEVEA